MNSHAYLRMCVLAMMLVTLAATVSIVVPEAEANPSPKPGTTHPSLAEGRIALHLVGGALHVVGRHSGHHLHLDQPALVANATVNSVMLARSAVGDGYHRRFAVQD